MSGYAHFDVEIERKVLADRLRWPSTRQLKDGSGLGGNRDYYGLGGMARFDMRGGH